MKRILLLFVCFGIIACHKDLDQNPIDPDVVSEVDVFEDVNSAKAALAKIYASFAVTGQQGPAGDADVQGFDEGYSQYTRQLWTLNELTTDHGIVAWGDPGLPNMHAMSWDANNGWTAGMYYRLGQVVSFANSFIANAAPLASDAEVQSFIAEAKFLRAYAYYNLLDWYANVPIVTEISAELPVQSNRTEIYNYIESELLALSNELKEPKANEYGRVDKAAAWALLSRLYLNAEVYIGESKYSESMDYADRVISSAYTLNLADGNSNGSAYDELFLADNNTNGAQDEAIFVVQFDGNGTQTWGGATFLVHASIGGNMDAAAYGVNGGWGGIRATKALVEKFAYSITATDGDGHPTSWSDPRAMFYTDGQSYEIENVSTFTDGYAVTKFKNIDSSGNQGSDSSGTHCDTDIHIIRLAEMYLNYAEAAVRSGANSGRALELINDLRRRAGAPLAQASEINTQFVMDERSRELYWEGTRRTDLIRDGKFVTSDYLWPFKAGAQGGAATDDYRRIYPIPADVLLVNTNLQQNPNY